MSVNYLQVRVSANLMRTCSTSPEKKPAGHADALLQGGAPDVRAHARARAAHLPLCGVVAGRRGRNDFPRQLHAEAQGHVQLGERRRRRGTERTGGDPLSGVRPWCGHQCVRPAGAGGAPVGSGAARVAARLAATAARAECAGLVGGRVRRAMAGVSGSIASVSVAPFWSGHRA